MFAWIILLAVVLILYCLFTALWFIVRDPTFPPNRARFHSTYYHFGGYFCHFVGDGFHWTPRTRNCLQ